MTNDELIEQNSIDGKYTYTYGRTNGYGLPSVEQMTRVVTQSGSTNTYNTSFINNPLTGEPLIQRTHTGAQNMYVYNGTPGAPIALLTTTGQVGMAERYDPYGVPIVTQGYASDAHEETPYTFGGAGVEMRQTGWVHYGKRFYSTITGTFTQQDTLDTPLNPANANRYAFAGGDPINNTDPAGLFFGDCAQALTGVGLGIVGTVGGIATAETGVGVALAAGSYAGYLLSVDSATEEC